MTITAPCLLEAPNGASVTVYAGTRRISFLARAAGKDRPFYQVNVDPNSPKTIQLPADNWDCEIGEGGRAEVALS